MAILGKWSGGVIGTMYLTDAWVAPNGLFPTQDRNDDTAYSFASTTSIVTLPSTGLADGYLLVASFEHETSQNDRHTPQGRIIQASGTGNFVGAPSGGYARDNSENRAYIRCWAFIDNPSASATLQFQWKRDNEDANAGDGTNRSEFQVIPFYYSDIGLYSSTDHSAYNGTTPLQVVGFSGTDGTNITMTSNVVTVTGDGKRYLALGSQFFEGRAGRTQRWHGFRIDGTKVDDAKAYSYYRESNNDENGDIFTTIIETVTASRTIDQFCYRGDGVASGQGGADGDGSDPGVGAHSLIVIELNDSAEVFKNTGTTNQNIATTGPVDVQVCKTGDLDFNDSDSFIRASDIAMNCESDMDVLLGANISAASQIVSSGARFTCYTEFTKNGTEDADSFAGDYLRNNQSSTDTFGWSANNLGFMAVASGDDVGVSATELSGTEGGGGAINIQVGWAGLWGINLDTLTSSLTHYDMPAVKQTYSVDVATPTTDLLWKHVLPTTTQTYAVTQYAVGFLIGLVFLIVQGTYAIDQNDSYFPRGYVLSTETQTYSITQYDVTLTYSSLTHYEIDVDTQSYSITQQDTGLNRGYILVAEVPTAGGDTPTLIATRATIASYNGGYATTFTVETGLTCQENDILLLHLLSGHGDSTNSIDPEYADDWPIIGESIKDGTEYGSSSGLWWARRGASAIGNVQVSFGGGPLTTKVIQIYQFRGCKTTGNPFESDSNYGPTITNNVPHNAVTTSGPNRLWTVFIGVDDNFTTTEPQDWTEEFSFTTTLGQDAYIALDTKEIPTATTTTLVNGVCASSADLLHTHTIALIPAAGVGETFNITGYDVGFTLGYTMPCTVQTYTVTQYDVTLTYVGLTHYDMPAAVQSYSVTQYDTDLLQGYTLFCTVQTYSVTQYDTDLLQGYVLPCTVQTYAVTQQDTGLLQGYTLVADQQTYIITQYDTGFDRTYILSCTVQTYAVTQYDVTLTYTPISAYELTADQQSYFVSPTVTGLFVGFLIDAFQQTYLLTGQDITLPRGYVMPAETGSYGITSYDTGFDRDYQLSCTPQSYSITQYDTGFDRTYVLPAVQQTYIIQGYNVGLSTEAVLNANTQTYSITPYDTNLEQGYVLPCTTQTYAITQQDTSLAKGYVLLTDVQTYVISQYDTGLLQGYVLPCTAQTYSVTQYDVNWDRTYQLEAVQQTYIIQGYDVEFVTEGKLDAETQTYSITPYHTNLEQGYKLEAETQSYTVTPYDTGLDLGYYMPCTTQVYSVTQYDTEFNRAYILPCVTQTYIIQGYNVAMSTDAILGASTQTYLVQGYDVGFKLGIVLPCEAQSYSVQGYDVGFKLGIVLPTTTQTYAITQYDTELYQGYQVAGDTQTYAITPYDVDLIYTGLTHYELTADTQSYIITQYDVGLSRGYQLNAETQTYAITPSEVSWVRGYVLGSTTQTYIIQGYDVDFLTEGKLEAETQTYVVNTYAAGLFKGKAFHANTANYTIEGQATGLYWKHLLEIEVAAYDITGQAIGLYYGRSLSADQQTYIITPYDVGFDRTYILPCTVQTYLIQGYDIGLVWETYATEYIRGESKVSTLISGDSKVILIAEYITGTSTVSTLISGDSKVILIAEYISGDSIITTEIIGESKVIDYV